jgi:hypothetical protein
MSSFLVIVFIIPYFMIHGICHLLGDSPAALSVSLLEEIPSKKPSTICRVLPDFSRVELESAFLEQSPVFPSKFGSSYFAAASFHLLLLIL